MTGIALLAFASGLAGGVAWSCFRTACAWAVAKLEAMEKRDVRISSARVRAERGG